MDNDYSAFVFISFRLNEKYKIEIFLNYGTFKRYGTRGMVHDTRVKIMVRLHNYGTVWQRWRRFSRATVDTLSVLDTKEAIVFLKHPNG